MYIPPSTEELLQMREHHIKDDYENYVIANSMVGLDVIKRSGKPFKSTSKVNTAKGVTRNPNTHKWGLTFEQDDSIVDVTHLRIL